MYVPFYLKREASYLANIFYDSELKLESVVDDKVTRKVKAHDKDLMMVELFFVKDAVAPLHSHEAHEQATYCLEGEFEFILGNEKVTVKAGDSLYIPKGVAHSASVKSDKGRLLDVFNPQRDDFL